MKISPNLIPSMEKQLLCATFLEAVIRFYENPDNMRAFERCVQRKEEPQMNQREADMLREEHPNFVPLKVAADYLGMLPWKLSELIAAGRKPYADLGNNIGTKQKYIRIYTARLIAYRNGTLAGV